MNIKNNEKGFTLLESLVAIVIMMIVTALSIPTYLQWHQNARYKGAARDIASLKIEAMSLAVPLYLAF